VDDPKIKSRVLHTKRSTFQGHTAADRQGLRGLQGSELSLGSKPQNNITCITISSSRSHSDHGFSQRDVYLSNLLDPHRYHYFAVISMTDRAKISSEPSWTSHSSRGFHLSVDHRSFKLIVSHHQTVTSVSHF
jgi:hypothetical protein